MSQLTALDTGDDDDDDGEDYFAGGAKNRYVRNSTVCAVVRTSNVPLLALCALPNQVTVF